MLITYRHFRTTYQSHLQGVKNPKRNPAVERVYIGKSEGSGKFCSVVSANMVGGSGWEGVVRAALKRDISCGKKF